MEAGTTYTAFVGDRQIASGELAGMLRRTKAHVDSTSSDGLLIFEDQSGNQVDFDFRGTVEEVLGRAMPSPPSKGPGRPKLGVVSREVSLLPRHWEWLEQQPYGISATLRRIVDEARKHEPRELRIKRAREAASKFMWAMAGNLPNFEEATRALFAGNDDRLHELMSDWPEDIQTHVVRLMSANAKE